MEEQQNPRSGKWKKGKPSGRAGVGPEELQGAMCGHGVRGQAESFMRTTKATADCVGVTCGKDVWTLVKDREEATFDEPEFPKGAKEGAPT